MRRDLLFAAVALVPVLLVSLGAGPRPEGPAGPPGLPRPARDGPVLRRRGRPTTTAGSRTGATRRSRPGARPRTGLRGSCSTGCPASPRLRERVQGICRLPRRRVLVDRAPRADALRDQEPAAEAAELPRGPALARGPGRRNARSSTRTSSTRRAGPRSTGSFPRGTGGSSPCRSRKAAARRAASTSTRRRPGARSPISSRASTAARRAATWPGTATAPGSSTRATRARASGPPQDLDFYQQVFFHRLGTPTESDVYALGKEFPRIAETTLDGLGGRALRARLRQERRRRRGVPVPADPGRPVDARSPRDADRVVEGRFGSDGSLYLLSRLGASRGRILRLEPGEPDARARPASSCPRARVDRGLLSDRESDLPRTSSSADRRGSASSGRDGQAIGTLPTLPTSSVSGLAPLGGDAILFENQSALVPPAWYRASADGAGLEDGARRGARPSTSPTARSCANGPSRRTARRCRSTSCGARARSSTATTRRSSTATAATASARSRPTPADAPRLARAGRRLRGRRTSAAAASSARTGTWPATCTNKQNVFDDFAACARAPDRAGYTKPARLAHRGRLATAACSWARRSRSTPSSSAPSSRTSASTTCCASSSPPTARSTSPSSAP